NAGKVAPLEWKKFIERLDASFGFIRKDHFLNGALALDALLRMFEIGEEHVLGAAQADTFRTHFTRLPRVLWRIGISAHSKLARFVHPLHQHVVGLRELRRDQRLRSEINDSFASIERDPIAFLSDVPVR